jgi:hypothetical protein
MKNVNVVIKKNSFGSQIFDKLYAYSQCLDNDYKSNLNISFGDQLKKQCINVLYCYMPTTLENFEDYDFVILDNADEPIGMVNTDVMIDAMHFQNVYLQANSVFHVSKNFNTNKIIRLHGDIENFKDCFTRPFYPQYYHQIEYKKHKTVCYLNGQNRAHRNHFMQLCKMQNFSIDIYSNISDIIHETNDSNLESAQDTKFRTLVNESYEIQRNQRTRYYANSISCGVDNKFGTIPPGYFLMPCYNEYQVIAFPESTWLNDELSVTEKALKCFVSKCLPFPVAGRHTNTLYYNSLGFYTAWNILPEELQQFDYEEDHHTRYKMMVDALQWISKNIQTCKQFEFYVEHNYKSYLDNKLSVVGVKKFYRVLDSL